jgi:putative phosphoribosyl transferase
MVFASREDAGDKLGRWLLERHLQADLVLGIPRGGVVVAAKVAEQLRLPLDILAVRKIGHPWQREFAVGALAEAGVVVLDEPRAGAPPFSRDELSVVITEESGRLRTYEHLFHPGGSPSLAGARVMLVDDGLATGATTEAAVLAARAHGARQVIVAVPIASCRGVERLRRSADRVVAMGVDPEFAAVGHYYGIFTQTTDAQVREILRTHQGLTSA